MEQLFEGATFSQGETVNKEQLILNFTEEKKIAVESINVVRGQIARLQVEEQRLIEVNLRLDGCLHALSQLSTDEKPVEAVEFVPDENVQPLEFANTKGE